MYQRKKKKKKKKKKSERIEKKKPNANVAVRERRAVLKLAGCKISSGKGARKRR